MCSFSLSLRLIHHFVPFKLNEEKYEKSTQFHYIYFLARVSLRSHFFSLNWKWTIHYHSTHSFLSFRFTSLHCNETEWWEKRVRNEWNLDEWWMMIEEHKRNQESEPFSPVNSWRKRKDTAAMWDGKRPNLMSGSFFFALLIWTKHHILFLFCSY